MLQDFANRAAQPPFYNLSDFDSEDRNVGGGGCYTWRAIQTAPALFQQAPASAACASSFEGFEACRLTLARLSGDVGTAEVSAEELQGEPRLLEQDLLALRITRPKPSKQPGGWPAPTTRHSAHPRVD